MAKAISLTTRQAMNASSTAEVEVVLATITHQNLVTPVYLSSDPTLRLSTDPLYYGTRSGGKEYLFVLMSAILPDDQREAPPRVTLIFDNVNREIIDQLRSILTPVMIDLTVVRAADPETPEATFAGFRGVKATYDASQITLEISREPFTSEPWPAGRMTYERFPGLHR